MSIIGFSGTRQGMTGGQKATLALLLRQAAELHHGDCVGSDAEAHALAEAVGLPVEIHPPSSDVRRAHCRTTGTIHEPLPYLERNRAIVDATDELIATPKETQEAQWAGTWATVRYARRVRKRVTIIWPDGSVSRSGGRR